MKEERSLNNGTCHVVEHENILGAVTSCCSPQSKHSSCSDNVQHQLPWWYPRYRDHRPIYHGNQEALGWAFDAIGRNVAVVGAGAFLGTALLKLAKEAAGCETEPAPGTTDIPECNERVYGIRPSSLLTTYTMVVGVASSTMLPLMGAIVDYTSHRRLIGRTLSTIVCVLLFPTIFISERTWFGVALIQIGIAFVGWAQTLVTYAYLPELSDLEDHLAGYTKSFTIISFSSMVIYLAGVVAISSVVGIDDIGTAQLGQAIAFGVSCTFLYLAWGQLMMRRPAARNLPEGHSLWTAGFIQIYHTSIHIYRHLPTLKWFYLSVSCIDSSVNSIATIMITYLTDTLHFSSTENGIAILLLLIGSIPGAMIAGKTVKLFNPIWSAMAAAVVLIANTIVASIILTGPGQQLETYFLATFYGVGTGWKWTADRLLASRLIPKGQEAELMGVYLFSSQILTWFPPLVFTVLNEAGVSQRVGIGTLSIYFLLGLICLALIGNYGDAVALARLANVSQNVQSNDGKLQNACDDAVLNEEEEGISNTATLPCVISSTVSS